MQRCAVQSFCEETGVSLSEIAVIGFHGQTAPAGHPPDREWAMVKPWPAAPGGPWSMACAPTAMLRREDRARRGGGYHRALAAALGERPWFFVNIGGVANLTWIGRDGGLVAFDTGPGNALLNDGVSVIFMNPLDRGGALAAGGVLDAKAFMALALSPDFDKNRFPSPTAMPSTFRCWMA